MNILNKVLLAIVVVLAVPMQAFAWGNTGHEIIGAIADRLIAGLPAEQKVKEVLQPGETLESVSTWADCARGYCGPLTEEMREFTATNPEHKQYHYTDVPVQKHVYVAGGVGTTDHDIVQTLQQCIAVLHGKTGAADNPHGFTKRQALLLLVHLVGDVHQPLHVGSVYLDAAGHLVEPKTQVDVDDVYVYEDRGGNYLQLGSKNLHEYWDTVLIAYAMRKFKVKTAEDFAVAVIAEHSQVSPSTGNPIGWPSTWADNSLVAARTAHAGLTFGARGEATDRYGKTVPVWPVTAPRSYAKDSTTLATQQLTKAGYRLAEVLVEVLR